MQSKSEIQIRPYQESDREEVIALWRASKRKAFPYVEIQQHYTLAGDTHYFQSVLTESCDIWLAENEEGLLGMMALEGDLINQLFVATTTQRRGVGTALLNKALELHPDRLRAFTFQKNRAARAFFEKHGFLIIDASLSPAPENEPDLEYCRQSSGWTTRMKPGRIRVIAICIFLNQNRIFVFKAYDKVKDQTFYRPLGGAVEFGEYSEQAIRREMQEEIKAEINNLVYLGTLENVFTLDGQPGHEVVFVFEGPLPTNHFMHKKRLPAWKMMAVLLKPSGKHLDDFNDPQVPLYPDGLLEMLHRQR